MCFVSTLCGHYPFDAHTVPSLASESLSGWLLTRGQQPDQALAIWCERTHHALYTSCRGPGIGAARSNAAGKIHVLKSTRFSESAHT